MTTQFNAIAPITQPPANYTSDPLQVTQGLQGLIGTLYSWTLKVSALLNRLSPGGGSVPVTSGGTGLSSGISGGIPYFNSSTTMASSGVLANTNLVVGGGAGGAPSTNPAWFIFSNILEGNLNAANIPSGISAVNGASLVTAAFDGNPNIFAEGSFSQASHVIGFRSEGTAATPLATGANQIINSFSARGFDGTNWVSSSMASLQISTQNQTSISDHSTVIKLNVTPKGSTTPSIVLQALASSDGGVTFNGDTTGGSATAGNVGEYLSQIVLVGSEVSINSAANVVTLGLSDGDWDVSGELWVDTSTGSATISGKVDAVITTSSATISTTPSDATAKASMNCTPLANGVGTFNIPVGPVRVNVTGGGTHNVFLVGAATVSGGTANGYGKLRARRIR